MLKVHLDPYMCNEIVLYFFVAQVIGLIAAFLFYISTFLKKNEGIYITVYTLVWYYSGLCEPCFDKINEA